jgi:hypothetical protein
MCTANAVNRCHFFGTVKTGHQTSKQDAQEQGILP